MENKVCESQETMILRAFESRAEGLKYLRTLPLEEKIALSKSLIVNCMEIRIQAVNILKQFLLLKKNAGEGKPLYPCILFAGMARYGPLSA